MFPAQPFEPTFDALCTSIPGLVGQIGAVSEDDEVAHMFEDKLFVAFIRFVAETGPTDLATMARDVLETRKISFRRSCA